MENINAGTGSLSKFGKAIILLLLMTGYGFVALAQNAPSHDPSTVIKGDDGRYWVFTTGDGIWCMSSSNANFSGWRAENTPFQVGTWPSWINSAVPGFAGAFWAPEIIRMGGYYYLYYSVSTFGSSRSAIGVVRTASLANPNWTDLGMVVSSNGGSSAINAIDPSLIRDSDGRVWMTYGSWFGGIGVVEINPSNGKAISGVTHLVGGGHQSIEAPYLLKQGIYYYLFINRGKCCNGSSSTYYVTVLRSTKVTGPYTDERTFLANKNGNIIGPGHIGYGEGLLTYHYYDGNNNGAAMLKVSTLGFRSGWPVAGATGDDGSTSGTVISGTYSIVAAHSGKAVDTYGWGTSNGTNIAQWDYTGNNAQKFTISSVDGIWHRITPVISSGQALDVEGCSASNGANLDTWEYWGGTCQQFKFQGAGSGRWRIINRNSNKCLDVEGKSTANGANILQWTCVSGATNQMFSLVKHSSEQVADAPVQTLSISPSPSNGNFTVSWTGMEDEAPVQIKVLNLQGSTVHQALYDATGSADLDLALAQGLYFLVLEQGGQQQTQKLVIK